MGIDNERISNSLSHPCLSHNALKKNDDLSSSGSEGSLAVGATGQSGSPHVRGIRALESRDGRAALVSSGARVDPGATEGRAKASSISGRD